MRDIMDSGEVTRTRRPAQSPPGGVRGPVFSDTGPRRADAGYSRFVAATKVALPIIATIVIALVAIWPYLQSKDSRFRLSFAALTPQEVAEPSMVNPRYVGSDSKHQIYSVTADMARAQDKDAKIVELEMPKADLTLEDGTWLVLTADTGVFRRDSDSLDLAGAVNLFHDSGYEFRTSFARVQLNNGVAQGAEPIRGQGPFGELEAQGFRIEGKGTIVVFTGRSRVVIAGAPPEETR